MLNIAQLRQCIIQPSLYDLKLNSDSAEELLVFTCAVESLGGTYLKQVNGPALGIYQMEPLTYHDLWVNYIQNKSNLSLILITNFDCVLIPDEHRLIYDLKFATAMARIFYHRIKEPLPNSKDINAIWEYYKKYYNTANGKAEKEDSIKKYQSFISRS